MTTFDEAFERVVGIEGKYSNNPNDSGGETMYGITAAVAKAHGYVGAMRNMPIGVAQAIYRAQYWDLLRLDDIARVSIPIAHELFDTAVNCGVGKAGTFLQRSLNVLNRGGRDYPDLTVDGVVGPMSVDALRRLLNARGSNGQTVMLRALNALQGAHYVALGEARAKDEDFEFGWFLNRVVI